MSKFENNSDFDSLMKKQQQAMDVNSFFTNTFPLSLSSSYI